MSTPKNKSQAWPYSPLVIGIYQVSWFNSRVGGALEKIKRIYDDPIEWNLWVEHTNSGRALKEAFGVDRYKSIMWRSPNCKPKDDTATLDYSELEMARIFKLKPEYVISFGDAAAMGVGKYLINATTDAEVFFCEHPTMEGSIMHKLKDASEWIESKFKK